MWAFWIPVTLAEPRAVRFHRLSGWLTPCLWLWLCPGLSAPRTPSCLAQSGTIPPGEGRYDCRLCLTECCQTRQCRGRSRSKWSACVPMCAEYTSAHPGSLDQCTHDRNPGRPVPVPRPPPLKMSAALSSLLLAVSFSRLDVVVLARCCPLSDAIVQIRVCRFTSHSCVWKMNKTDRWDSGPPPPPPRQ